jgi:hypothetical protein
MNERPELSTLQPTGKADAHYFRRKADQCRRLARSIFLLNDPTAASLFALAVEYFCRHIRFQRRPTPLKSRGILRRCRRRSPSHRAKQFSELGLACGCDSAHQLPFPVASWKVDRSPEMNHRARRRGRHQCGVALCASLLRPFEPGF